MARGDFGNKRNTNGLDKNPQNRNIEGRPKKIYTILKEKGYNATDIRIAFGELAFYTINELREIKDDLTKPIITRIVANQFFTAFNENDWYKIKDILEHVIGKAIAPIEHSGEIDNLVNIIIKSHNGKEKK